MNAKTDKKPDISPRQRRSGSTWYVLVTWGDRPSEEVGGFPSEIEAKHWVDHESQGWLRSRQSDSMFG